MDQSTNVAKTSAETDIFKLPHEILAQLFSFLSFTEIASIRQVCKTFHNVAASVLKSEFRNLCQRIENQFQWTKSQLLIESHEEKKLQLVRLQNVIRFLYSEYMILRAICWNYVEKNQCCFFGGKILDEFNSNLKCNDISSVSEYSPLPDRANKIFILVTKFISFFEDKIELSLQDPIPFGVKVINILNCCLSSNYDLRLSVDEENISHLRGTYDIMNINGITAPPEFTNSSVYKDNYKLRFLAQYLRNIVRWNNAFQSLKKLWNLEQLVKSGDSLTSVEVDDFPLKQEGNESVDLDNKTVSFYRKQQEKNYNHLFRCPFYLTCYVHQLPLLFQSKERLLYAKRNKSICSIVSDALLRASRSDIDTNDQYSFWMKLHVNFRPFQNLPQFNIVVNLHHTTSSLSMNSQTTDEED